MNKQTSRHTNTKNPGKTQYILPGNVLYALHNDTPVPAGMAVVVLNKNLQGAKRYSPENVKMVPLEHDY